jgi:hypothetical protein
LHTHNFRALVVLVCLAVLGTTVVHAQDNNLSRAYHAVPKAGMAAQFEAAVNAHTQWRKDNGDPWTWGVSVYDTGEHFGTYSVFSGGHSWADFDAYDAGFGPRGLLHWIDCHEGGSEALARSREHDVSGDSRHYLFDAGIRQQARLQLRPGDDAARESGLVVELRVLNRHMSTAHASREFDHFGPVRVTDPCEENGAEGAERD